MRDDLNKLNAYLFRRGIPKSEFAARVGSSPTAISALCKDPPRYWPGRELCLRVREETLGEITPNDFLPDYQPPGGASENNPAAADGRAASPSAVAAPELVGASE